MYLPGPHIRVVGGRHGDPQAVGLSRTLESLGFPLARLTTSTPPRLDRRSINYEGLEPQYSDDPPCPFSFLNEYDGAGISLKDQQVPCYYTQTNLKTHQVIRNAMHLLPTFEGNNGRGRGPR